MKQDLSTKSISGRRPGKRQQYKYVKIIYMKVHVCRRHKSMGNPFSIFWTKASYLIKLKITMNCEIYTSRQIMTTNFPVRSTRIDNETFWASFLSVDDFVQSTTRTAEMSHQNLQSVDRTMVVIYRNLLDLLYPIGPSLLVYHRPSHLLNSCQSCNEIQLNVSKVL